MFGSDTMTDTSKVHYPMVEGCPTARTRSRLAQLRRLALSRCQP